MSVFKIDETDILWRYYCRIYELQEIPVEPPANFCNYFWGGVFGMIGSFWAEARLWLVWLITCSAFAVTWYLASLAPPDSVQQIVLIPLAVILGFVVATTMLVTGGRLKGWRAKCYGSLWGLIGLAIVTALGIGMYSNIRDAIIAGTFLEGLMGLLAVLAGGLLVVAGLFIGVGLMVLITKFIISPVCGWRFMKAIGVYIMSLKRKICPMVEPPESFMAEYDSRDEVAIG